MQDRAHQLAERIVARRKRNSAEQSKPPATPGRDAAGTEQTTGQGR